MVTKYDLFEYMYKKGGVFRPGRLAVVFRKSRIDYHGLYNILLNLKKLKLVNKSEHGFQVLRTQKNDLLYRLIRFCLKNDINYNELLDKNLAAFISRAFLKKRFTVKGFTINPRTFSKYVDILMRSGLLITISKKPLTATIPYNSFLRDLIAYFGQKVLVAKSGPDEYFDEIEKELKRFGHLRNINETGYQRLVRKYQMRFIHHSLSLEGNPITLPDTIMLLKNHITPPDYSVESVNEVQNYQKAISQMNEDAEEDKPIIKETILDYHALAMGHRPGIAGRIRNRAVVIRGNPDFKIAKASEIEPKLAVLLKRYNQFVSRKRSSLKRIIKFAAYFHNEFQHIHPFEDGNSRTARLITFHLLRTQNIPILDIPLGLLEEYLGSTKAAKSRDDDRLSQALQKIILYNLKTVNGKLSA
ncbi:MAG TPA: Fic family protein [Candidatus Scalindua sp.]|nr:Fic family protein [Candidatus Scalindua sp.]